MPVIYSNNASTTLSSGINDSTTTIAIASASGFPTIGSNEYYFATIANTNNTKIEVVKVTAGTTSLTVVRGQDGTTAQAFDSGDNFQLRVTAATLGAATKTDVNITGGAIAGAAISNDAIDSQHYADGSIDTAHLSDDVVTQAKIADDAVGSPQLAAGAVDTTAIGNDAVTTDKLANSINTDIATGVTAGTTASAALPKTGGAMTGAITTNSTFDGRDVATDGTKLDGIEASADVTDATNVAAAGALMKSGGTMTGSAQGSTDTDTSNTGSVTLNFSTNQNFVLTLTGNVTLANPTTETVGQSGFITFIQDSTGGRTVSLGTDFETAAGAGLTLTSTASATDIVPYVVVASGRILLGTPQLAFA